MRLMRRRRWWISYHPFMDRKTILFKLNKVSLDSIIHHQQLVSQCSTAATLPNRLVASLPASSLLSNPRR